MKVLAWNIALSALLGLAALAALEGYLRYTIPPMQEGRLYEYSAQGKRFKLMKPLADMRIFGARVQTNELGFRDNRPRVAAKQPGEFRIVVLGDSFTFGPGVEYEHLYTSLLRSRLARAHPEVSVINLAVEGYNIMQYQAVLEEVALKLQPDLLVLAMFPVNDFELGDYENHRRIAAGAEPHLPWYLSLYSYRAYLYRVPDLAAKALHRVLPATEKAPDQGWELNVAALKEIHAVAQGRSLPLAVALLPHTKGLETQRAIFARVKAVCEAERLDCLDLLEVVQGLGVRDGALVLNAIDSHPNDEYHRIIAAQLAPRLAPWLPAPLATPVISPNGPRVLPDTRTTVRPAPRYF
jgi:lysophospholipase L1-like esterase